MTERPEQIAARAMKDRALGIGISGAIFVLIRELPPSVNCWHTGVEPVVSNDDLERFQAHDEQLIRKFFDDMALVEKMIEQMWETGHASGQLSAQKSGRGGFVIRIQNARLMYVACAGGTDKQNMEVAKAGIRACAHLREGSSIKLLMCPKCWGNAVMEPSPIIGYRTGCSACERFRYGATVENVVAGWNGWVRKELLDEARSQLMWNDSAWATGIVYNLVEKLRVRGLRPKHQREG